MTKLKIRRSVWTFPELGQRYKDKPPYNQIRQAVEQGVLRPSFWVNRADMREARVEAGRVVVSKDVQPVNGFLYPLQEYAEKFDTFDFLYPLWGDRPQAGEGCRLWAFPENITLSHIINLGVVRDEDVKAAESAGEVDRTLSTKEEQTRDAIIVALTMELYGWDPASERSTGVTGVLRLLEANGMPRSYNTVREHLKLAWQRCQPKVLDA